MDEQGTWKKVKNEEGRNKYIWPRNELERATVKARRSILTAHVTIS